MQVLRAIYLSVLFALAMGLFCGELPESFRLMDDTSNDYVADSSASAARENEATQERERQPKPAVSEVRLAASATAAEPFIAAFSLIEPAPITGKELLPLLSIRRT